MNNFLRIGCGNGRGIGRCIGALLVAAVTLLQVARADEPKLQFREIAATDGTPLNVVETGNPQGQPVLLLHGYSQSYLSFHEQLADPQLQARFRLVAMDLRGHGGSGKPWTSEAYAGHLPWARDLRRVIETLGLDRPVIVGWSFGGFVAMDYVREYGPQAVTALVLTGSHGGLLPRPAGTPPRYVGDLDGAIRGAREFMRVMSAKPVSQEAVDRGTYTNVMMPAYVRNAMPGKRLDNTDMLPTLSVPTLVILGDRDGSLPAEAVRKSLAVNSRIETLILPGVGHSAFLEDPATFDRELLRFATAARATAAGTAAAVSAQPSAPP
jgi:pimeloyl-ACP methyl ester carboxylesterase